MSRQRAVNLRQIADEAMKPPERTRSFVRVRGDVSCTLSRWSLQAHACGGAWSVRADVPGHLMTMKEMHEWAAERLRAWADEQDMEAP